MRPFPGHQTGHLYGISAIFPFVPIFFSSADFRRRLLGGDHCCSSTQALLWISVLLASVKTALSVSVYLNLFLV